MVLHRKYLFESTTKAYKMTTLPRLSTKETPFNICMPQEHTYFRRSHTCVQRTHPLSKSWGGTSSMLAHDNTQSLPKGGTLPRINPLRPPCIKRTVDLETTDAHYANHSRTNIMKRAEYDRFHTGWAKPFYGNKVEQENYRKNIREVLKGQISGKDEIEQQQLKDKVRESEDAVNFDRKCLDEDKEAYKKRISFLMQFRDENKRLIESREEQRRIDFKCRHRKEQELLRFNPVNWSQTLR
ncbi:uncharacterized protein [Antedon mediterranea]|uniref:uncharacterized protein n=1 Tax=Antedon mediterranea TaxID=105859 RepID=UPI003AF44CA1